MKIETPEEKWEEVRRKCRKEIEKCRGIKIDPLAESNLTMAIMLAIEDLHPCRLKDETKLLK